MVGTRHVHCGLGLGRRAAPWTTLLAQDFTITVPFTPRGNSSTATDRTGGICGIRGEVVSRPPNALGNAGIRPSGLRLVVSGPDPAAGLVDSPAVSITCRIAARIPSHSNRRYAADV